MKTSEVTAKHLYVVRRKANSGVRRLDAALARSRGPERCRVLGQSLATLLVILLIGTVGDAKATDYESYSGWAVDATPVLPASETHPSLWFSAADVPAVLAKKDEDAAAAAMWDQVVSSPHLTMSLPETPPADAETKSIHQYYGDMSQIAKYAGFMVQMSADGPERDHSLARAKDALLRAFDGPIYDLDPKVSSSPVDEIYIGVWLQNYAAAYDWVQPFLTAEEDNAIRARLAKQATWVADNLHIWVDRPHNHLSKPAWGLGSMALAMPTEPGASDWLRIALEAANQNTRYFFSADGIYREGSHYLIFSWINFVPFMYHYRNVSGVDQFPANQPLMEWGIAVRNGKGWLPNFEDSFIRPFPAHMVAGAYRNAPTRLHSSAPLASVLQWARETTDLDPFIESEKTEGFNYTGASWDYTLPLDEYLMEMPGIKPVAPDISPTVFLDGGQTVFRSTWAPSDPALRYLLFQGVAEADNHQHEDHLSFIMFAENQMMASDGGYTRKSYGEPIRKSWYRLAPAHNVVTLDGKPPVDEQEGVTPASRYRIDTAFFDFEEKEAPYPDGGSLKRAIAFPGESYFVVADTVRSPSPAPAALYLHGGRGTIAGEGDQRTWTFAQDAYGPPARLHAWILGGDEPLQDHEGELTYIKGDYAAFPYVTAHATGEAINFLQILVPSGIDAPPPPLRRLEAEGAVAARIAVDGAIDTLVLQPGPNPVAAGDIETDGTFCWVREKDGAVQVGLREGTYVRLRGDALVTSPSPMTGAFEVRDGEIVSRHVADGDSK